MVADRNPEAIADVIAAGAETASTAKAIAEQCDVIITMLPNSPHVKEVALGENGIIEGAKPWYGIDRYEFYRTAGKP